MNRSSSYSRNYNQVEVVTMKDKEAAWSVRGAKCDPSLLTSKVEPAKEPMRGGMASSSLHSPPLPTASGC